MLKSLLGESLYNLILQPIKLSELTEVRLRLNLPVAVKDFNKRFILNFIADRALIDQVVARATQFSLYAHCEELSNGFLSYGSGVRLGIAGVGVVENNKLITYKNISSINIRIPHEVIGASKSVQSIIDNFENTLVVSPPFGGKTTLIRDMARALSNNYDITIIDERGEISGDGFKLGRLTDVIVGVPKNLAYEAAIRALSPEIIVLDELFPKRDISVVEEICRSGVKMIASLHSGDIEDLKKANNPILSYFKYCVTLSYKPKVGSIKSIERIND